MGRKLTHDEFLERVREKRLNITVLGKYEDMATKIRIKCNQCSDIYMSAPCNILSGKNCPQCNKTKMRNNRIKSHEMFLEEVKDRFPNVIVENMYNGAFEKLNLSCSLCGNNWVNYPHALLKSKHGCPKCGYSAGGKANRKNNEVFVRMVKAANPEIVPLETYKTATQKILFKCLKCGNEWKTMPVSITSNMYGCPVCQSSHGERVIGMYLNEHDVTYIRQKKFEELRGVKGRCLSYDFYLPDYNILIEYQGQFHDHTTSIQTEEEYLIQKEHDRRKRSFAEKHGYILLEIWYNDINNIESILNNALQDPVTSIA